LADPSLADVPQYIEARRHRKAIVDDGGLRAMVVGAVHDKADFRLDRAAREHADVASDVSAILAKRASRTLAIEVSPIGLLMMIPTAPFGSSPIEGTRGTSPIEICCERAPVRASR
jgi:hypothetical protein